MPPSWRRTRPIPATGMRRATSGSASTVRDPHEYWQGAAAAAPKLDAFLDAELARARTSPMSDLALVGFSQGTMMALQVGPRRRHLAGGDRRLFRPHRRGRAAGPRDGEPGAGAAGAWRTRRGDPRRRDGRDGRGARAAAGFSVKTVTRPSLGHGIDPAGPAGRARHFCDRPSPARSSEAIRRRGCRHHGFTRVTHSL